MSCDSSKPNHNQANLEIDRMQMEAEDDYSMKVEVFNHKQKFA